MAALVKTSTEMHAHVVRADAACGLVRREDGVDHGSLVWWYHLFCRLRLMKDRNLVKEC